jgi:hypothetical protein
MAIDQKKRQKKLAKKAAKRKMVLAEKRKGGSFSVTKDQALCRCFNIAHPRVPCSQGNF